MSDAAQPQDHDAGDPGQCHEADAQAEQRGGPAGSRLDVASIEVLPERGLGDAVAGPAVVVGAAAAVPGAAEDSAGAGVPAGTSAGTGSAADPPGREPQAGPAGPEPECWAAVPQAPPALQAPPERPALQARQARPALLALRAGVPRAAGVTVRRRRRLGAALAPAPARQGPRRRWAAARAWTATGLGEGCFDGASRPSIRPARPRDCRSVAPATEAEAEPPVAACAAGAPAEKASTTPSAAAAVPRRSPPW